MKITITSSRGNKSTLEVDSSIIIRKAPVVVANSENGDNLFQIEFLSFHTDTQKDILSTIIFLDGTISFIEIQEKK